MRMPSFRLLHYQLESHSIQIAVPSTFPMQATSTRKPLPQKMNDTPDQLLQSLAELMLGIRGLPPRPRWAYHTKEQIPPLPPTPPRPRQTMKPSAKQRAEDSAGKHKLGQAMPILFVLLRFYGIDFAPAEMKPATQWTRIRRRLSKFLSYSIDIVCVLPYIVYSIVVVDPMHSTRAFEISAYLLKINLFTFGLSRLIMKNHSDRFDEIRERLSDFEVDTTTFNKARQYAARLVFFIMLAVSLSLLVLFSYLVCIFVICHCATAVVEKRSHCTSSVWLNFCYHSVTTSLFTAICFFSFACIAFAFICCAILQHNLKMATDSIMDAPSTRNVAERFVHFVNVHVETQQLIDLIDTVFSKIPFLVILVQISSVSQVLRIPSCTYVIIDEKIMAFCSCITNIALYCIAILWIMSASRLNQEFYRSIRILCFILVKHERFLGPVWMKQLVLNYMIYVEYLKIKPAGITLGGYSFAEALDNARIFQYSLDFLNAI